MLSYEILDGFVFAFVQFNCWIHILILCFLGFAICALCHHSCCMPVLSVDISLSASFLYLIIFSSITACYHFSVSLGSLLAVFFRSFLLTVSRVSVLLLAGVFGTSRRSVNLLITGLLFIVS